MSKLDADSPQTADSIGFVYVYEIGLIAFDLVESATIASTKVTTGKVREVLYPIPYGPVMPDESYVLITTEGEVTTVVLLSSQPVL